MRKNSIFKRFISSFMFLLLLTTLVACKKEPEKDNGNPLDALTISGDLNNVKENLALVPKITYNEVTYDIIWHTSNEDVISSLGRVIRPKHNEQNIEVTLTAVLKQDPTRTKLFKAIVIKTENIYEDALQRIDIPYLYELHRDVEIPFIVVYEDVTYTLVWRSSDESAIEIDNAHFKAIVNNDFGDSKEVKITASISDEHGEVKASRGFPINVLGKGYGTLVSPYLVYDEKSFEEDIKAHQNNTDVYFKLIDDITLDFDTYRSIPSFKGNLNGGFKTISLVYTGSYYAQPTSCVSLTYSDCFGIFNELTNATIIELDIRVDIEVHTGTNKTYFGTLAGIAHETVNIIDVDVFGSYDIVGNNSIADVYIGGLIGKTSNLNIYEANNELDITLTSNNKANYIGGLVGYTNYVDAENCSNTGYLDLVIGNATSAVIFHVGGLFGHIDSKSTIKESSSGVTMAIDIEKESGLGANFYEYKIGGIVGYADNTFIENSYADGAINFKSINSLKSNIIIGGIMGEMVQSTARHSYLSKSYSSSNISVELNTATQNGETTVFVGGLIGRFSNGHIESSFATSNVSLKTRYDSDKDAFAHIIHGSIGYINKGASDISMTKVFQRFYPYGIDTTKLCDDKKYVSNGSKANCVEMGGTLGVSRLRPENMLKSVTYTYNFSFSETIWDFSNLGFADMKDQQNSKFYGPTLKIQM